MGKEYANVEDLLHDMAEGLGDRSVFDLLKASEQNPHAQDLLLDVESFTALLKQLRLKPDPEVVVAALLAGNMLYGSHDSGGKVAIPVKNLHAMIEDRNHDHIRTVTSNYSPPSSRGGDTSLNPDSPIPPSLLPRLPDEVNPSEASEFERHADEAYGDLASPHSGQKMYTRADASILREFIFDTEAAYPSRSNTELIHMLEDFLVDSRLDEKHDPNSDDLPRGPDDILRSFLTETTNLSPGPGLVREKASTPVQVTPAKVKSQTRPTSRMDLNESASLVQSAELAALRAAGTEQTGADSDDEPASPHIGLNKEEEKGDKESSSEYETEESSAAVSEESSSDEATATESATATERTGTDASQHRAHVVHITTKKDSTEDETEQVTASAEEEEQEEQDDADSDSDVKDSFMITQSTKFDYGHDDPEEVQASPSAAEASARRASETDETGASGASEDASEEGGTSGTSAPVVPPLDIESEGQDDSASSRALPASMAVAEDDDIPVDEGSDEEISESVDLQREGSHTVTSARSESSRGGDIGDETDEMSDSDAPDLQRES